MPQFDPTPKAKGGFVANLACFGFLMAVLAFFCVCGGLLFWFFFPATAEIQYYAIRYDVSSEGVHYLPKPHDCDFDKAPLGNKECHYDREVSVEENPSHTQVTGLYVGWKKVQE
jgi:hypothetical protein